MEQEEHAATRAAEVSPSAACWPALGTVSVSLSCSQQAQINRQAELSGSLDPASPLQRQNYPTPLQAPIPPTKQLFTPKHPEDGGTVLITPQRLVPAARELHRYLSSPAAGEPVTSPEPQLFGCGGGGREGGGLRRKLGCVLGSEGREGRSGAGCGLHYSLALLPHL